MLKQMFLGLVQWMVVLVDAIVPRVCVKHSECPVPSSAAEDHAIESPSQMMGLGDVI